jgi:hypothetical protein
MTGTAQYEDCIATALALAKASNQRQIEQGANNAWLSYTSAHIAIATIDSKLRCRTG